MLGAEGGSTRGDGGVNTGCVGCHDVGIPLHDDDLAFCGDVFACEIETVKHLRFLVNGGLGRVEVFRTLIVLKEPARAEADRFACYIANRPHEAPTKTIVDTALALRDEPAESQLFLRKTARAQVPREVVPPLRREADPEVGGRARPKITLCQKSTPDLSFGAREVFAEEFLRYLVGREQPLAGTKVGAWTPIAITAREGLFIPQLDAVARGQVFDGFGEAHVVDLLDELDHIATFAAAKAVVATDRGANIERRSFFVVERAQALHRT